MIFVLEEQLFFFHAELKNWEMMNTLPLYSNTIFGFFQKFPLIISAKGVGVRCERDHCPVLALFVITWFTADLWDPDK